MTTWQGAPPPVRRRPIKRRHPGRTLLIVVLVIVVLLVIADRVGLFVAERIAGDTIESSQHLTSRPDVDIAGFPFLTQLATGSSDKITVTADDVPLDAAGRAVQLSRVQVVLHHVTVSRTFDNFHADSADATATMTYAQLGNALGIDVRYAGDGRIKAAKSITVLGQRVTGSISTRPELANGALVFGATAINGLNDVSRDVAGALDKIFGLHIPLSGIPFGVHVQSLSLDDAGVHLALTGTDLSYRTGN